MYMNYSAAAAALGWCSTKLIVGSVTSTKPGGRRPPRTSTTAIPIGALRGAAMSPATSRPMWWGCSSAPTARGRTTVHLRQVEVFCYAQVDRPDGRTQTFQGLADRLAEQAVGMFDDELAAQIRADRIDILVDLAGHTGANRLPMFALKPRKHSMQVTLAGGYPNTTGLSGHGLPAWWTPSPIRQAKPTPWPAKSSSGSRTASIVTSRRRQPQRRRRRPHRSADG